MHQIHLPLNILYLVACHLAGDHAFGTLAALHLANHSVAGAVLPVLYETLLMDGEDNMPYRDHEQTLPDRFSHTK
jgi:hypothetical protein